MSNLRVSWQSDADFVAFLRAYPRRVAVAVAFQAWQRTRAVRPPLDVLMRAIASAVEWRRQLEGARQFVPAWPYPATWLNQQRWEDQFDSLAGTPTLDALPTVESADQQAQRRLAQIAMDCWIQIRAAVLKNEQRPLMGWGHAAADVVLNQLGGLPMLDRHRNRLPQAQAKFLALMDEAMRSPANASTTITPLRRSA